jgi:hypothetical protein
VSRMAGRSLRAIRSAGTALWRLVAQAGAGFLQGLCR